MHVSIKIVALSILAVLLLLVWMNHQSALQREAWLVVHQSEDQNLALEELEKVRDRIVAGDAAAWIDFRLAMLAYSQPGTENHARARQVAEAAQRERPSHASSRFLRQLIQALNVSSTRL